MLNNSLTVLCKSAFVCLLICFVTCNTHAQSTVTIGTGTAADYNFPFQPYFNNGWSSQIYTATEIGTAGTINSLAFYVNNSSGSYTLDNQKIYVRHTSVSQHADKYYPGTTGFTLVYSGSITFGTSGWKTINLSSPFTYNGTSNLEVLIESRDGSTFTSALQTRYTSKSEYRTKYDYNDYNFPTTWYAGGRVTKLPNIQFVINTCTTVAGTTSASSISVCAGNTTMLILTGQTAGQNIQWQESTDNTTFTDINSAISSTFTTPALTSIKYYRAKVGTGSCIVYSNVQTISVTSLPSSPSAGNNGPLCVGSTLNLIANTIAGATYAWTGPNNFTSTSQNPSIVNITSTGAGIYSVTTTLNGCTSAASSTSVITNAIPGIPTAGNNGPLCVGSTLNLTASAIAGATFAWTGPNSFTSTSQNPIIANISTLDAGIYSVTATLNGCKSVAGTSTVTVNIIPSTPIVANNGVLCAGSTLNLTSSTITGATYAWTGPNSFTSTSQNPIIENISTLGAGIYSVTASVNGCISELGTTSVTVNSIPTTPIVGNNGVLCAGSTLNLTASTITGATYTWTGPNSFTSISQNPSIANINTLGAGTYSVTASVNGCTSEVGTTSVIVNSIPTPPIVGNNGALCAGSTLNLTASTITGATYAWTGPNSFTSTSQNPSIANITSEGSGTYSVTATVNGCVSAAGTTNLNVNITPSKNIINISNTEFCSGDRVLLTTSFDNQSQLIKWYELNSSNSYDEIIGANTNQYLTTPITQTKQIRTEVSNGICRVFSDVILLQVNCKSQQIFSKDGDIQVSVDLSSIQDKQSPYFYILSPKEIPTYQEIISFDSEFSKSSTLTTQFTFTDLDQGSYFLKVFDSRGISLIDKNINLYQPIEFISESSLQVSGNKVFTGGVSSFGETNKVINKSTNSTSLFKINDLHKIDFLGFKDISNESTNSTALKYGFIVQENKLNIVDNGSLVPLYDISSNVAITLGINQTKTGFEYEINGQPVRSVLYPANDFTYNEIFGIEPYGSFDYFSEGLEWQCFECPPSVEPKATLNNCLDNKGSLEFNITGYSNTIMYFRLYSPFNQLITPDVNSSSNLFSYSNLEPGEYRYEYAFKWDYYRGYWRNSPIRVVTKPITIDSKLVWSNYSNTIYSSINESIVSTSTNVNFNSAESLNETHDDLVTYYIDFELLNGDFIFSDDEINWRVKSKRVLSWDPNFKSSSISNFDLKITSSPAAGDFFTLNSQNFWVKNRYSNSTSQKYSRFRYTFTPSNMTVGLVGYNTQTLNWDNLITNVSSNFDSKIHNIKFYSDREEFGLKNAHTNLHCLLITYVKLERDLKGVNYNPIQNRMYFYYDEEYTGSLGLKYKVYNNVNEVVLSPTNLILTKKYGDNRYDLDVTSLSNGTYILEVTNEKNEKFYLRFTKK